MEDHLLVEALRRRDPGALTAVYDAHADRLYAYCWFQLRHRDAAQVALRETFLVADAHVGELREPERFTPWLYALARLECARRLPPGDQPPDVPIARHDQEDADRRIIAWQTVLALRPENREILELHVRHSLSVPDIAGVFDISLTDVESMLDDAHRELAEALTAEMLAYHGPYGCAERAALLRDRHGVLTRERNRRLTQHAEECSVCGRLRPRTVSAAKVYGLLPAVQPPPELRLRVMSCFLDPELVGYRLFVTGRVTEFTSAGFPVQTSRPRRRAWASNAGGLALLRRLRRTLSPSGEPDVRSQAARAVTALAVMAVMGGGGAAFMYGLLGPGRDADTVTGARPTVRPGVPQHPPEGPAADRPESASHLNAAHVSATFPLGATASPAPPIAHGTSPTGPMNAPARTADKDALSVSPLFLDLAGGSDGTLYLRAEGESLTWRATTDGDLSVHPSSGHLAAGQRVTVRVHVTRKPDSTGGGTITFTPGGIRVRVTWRPAAPSPQPAPEPTPTRSIPSDPSTPPGSEHPPPSTPPSSGTGPSSPTGPSTRPSPPASSGPPPSGGEPASPSPEPQASPDSTGA
ncbi:MAG TPA: hypothetical protein VIL71_13205 [Spirillospora sp.]